MNKAFVFPGQGSQIIGMGKDFYDAFATAREVFQEVDETLKFNLSKIIFEGPEADLTSTVNTQAALMATSIAILRTLLKESNKKIQNLCSITAGHSLGEYSALCAAGSMILSDTANLLRVRGSAMQEACPEGVGAMAACIGIELDLLEDVIGNAITSGVCQIANDNIAGQIVISGHNQNIDNIVAILKDLGYKAIKLKVSAPFHSTLMKPAEVKMTEALANVNFNSCAVPIVANVTAQITNDPVEIKSNLITQICGRVRWRETLNEFARLEVTEIVEIGSGKVLSGLARKSGHDFETFNISNVAELEEYLKRIG
jgi:[acyl-carrier-protein] S-malonyltransferase